MVLHIFSKWAGLASLLVGYSVSHPHLNAAMIAIKQPYNCNVAADVGARAALAHAHKVMTTQVAPLQAELRVARDKCIALGWLLPNPTDTNFTLIEVAAPWSAVGIVAALRKRGILICYYPRGQAGGTRAHLHGAPH